MNKATDRIPVELFQILKDDAVKLLHSKCQQIWKIQQWSQDWKRLPFISIPKKGNAKECSNYCTIVLISHARKLIVTILQARLQQYLNWEFPGVQVRLRKGRGTRDQIANIHWIIGKARQSQKNIYFCFIDYTKASDCVDHNKLWKILKRDGNPRPPYWSLEKSVCRSRTTLRIVHGTMVWFQIEKGVHQGCVLSPGLFNLYAEYIMRNANLDESQSGIKITRRYINNLRYAEDTTLWQKAKKN